MIPEREQTDSQRDEAVQPHDAGQPGDHWQRNGAERPTGMPGRAAVLGHPIGHSLSPALHGAVAAELGLPWSYGSRDVTEDGLAGLLSELDDSWVGLSLTMPLKQRVLELADTVDDTARVTGAGNTLVWDQARGRRVANTDVAGIVAALREGEVAPFPKGIPRAGAASASQSSAASQSSGPSGRRALVLGGGATAASAVAALHQMGATSLTVLVRSVARAGAVERAAEQLGAPLELAELHRWPERLAGAHLVVSTLPAGAADPLAGAVAEVPVGQQLGVLLDVAYVHRPSALGLAWQRSGGGYVSGERMLLHQAVEQVRLFAAAAGVAVPDRSALVAIMDRVLRQRL